MNMLISAMSTSSKLTVCLVFLIVVLALEVGAFVGLFVWKKKVMKPAKKPSAQDTPVAENSEAQESVAEAQEPVAETHPVDNSGEQPAAAETEAAQPVADGNQNQVEHEVSTPETVDTTVAQEENNNTLEGDNPNA